MSFSFTGRVDVTSVNTRKEKHGDERVLAVDIGIEAEGVPAAIVAELLDVPAKTFEHVFWDSKGKPNMPKIGPLPITTKFKAQKGAPPGSDSDHAVTLEDYATISDRASIIDKFKAVPVEGGKCFLSFRIAITDPTHEMVCLATDVIQDSVMLTITPDDAKGSNEVMTKAEPELPLGDPNAGEPEEVVPTGDGGFLDSESSGGGDDGEGGVPEKILEQWEKDDAVDAQLSAAQEEQNTLEQEAAQQELEPTET